MGNGMLIIEPAKSKNGGEFDEQILADLIKEGYSGDELLTEFKGRRAQIRPVIEAMLKATEDAVKGIGEHYTLEDVFAE